MFLYKFYYSFKNAKETVQFFFKKFIKTTVYVSYKENSGTGV